MTVADKQSIAGAYAKIEGHETLCDERHRTINGKLNGLIGGMAAIVISLVAWMAAQLYSLEPLRIAAAQQAQIQALKATP